MGASSLRGLQPSRLLSRKSLSCFIFPGSDDSILGAPTPIARPIEIPPPEKLQSLSPIRTAAEDPNPDASSPVATPIHATSSFELSTLPRPSLSTSKIEFETPPPPKAFPTPWSTSSNPQNDVSLSVNVTMTPSVAGVWAATPQPTSSSSAPPSYRAHDRIRSLRLLSQRSNLRLLHLLSRAGTLPVRTPAPPGGWFLTPGSLRRKSLLKVRSITRLQIVLYRMLKMARRTEKLKSRH